jgi:hypothetical protein
MVLWISSPTGYRQGLYRSASTGNNSFIVNVKAAILIGFSQRAFHSRLVFICYEVHPALPVSTQIGRVGDDRVDVHFHGADDFVAGLNKSKGHSAATGE